MENIKLCEVCKKEHDGSYGSGRFCSYSCRQKYSAIKGGAASSKIIKEKFGIKCQCEFCNKEFGSKLDLKKHLSNCDKKLKFNSAKHGNWNCCICDKVFDTRSKLFEHKHNEHYKDGIHANKAIIAKMRGEDFNCSEETRKKISESSKGRKHSEETKKRLSETMKRKIAEGSFIVPYKRNHSSKVSYPEKYFMEVFKELPVKYNYQVGLYQLDFAIPEKKIYVEIDGEQHYVDKRIIKHDKERTEKLNALGWNCLRRVRWSEFQKLSQNEKANYCDELISELQSL